PGWMVDELQFPYTAGESFVMRLQASGGSSAVDAAFRRPPASTEQILHPGKWATREAPVKVTTPPLAHALGSGWRDLPADTLGEAMVRIWLSGVGVSASDAEPAADGWGGDRLVAASGPGGSSAVAWRLAWDTPADATQFAATYRAAAARLKLSARLVALWPRRRRRRRAAAAARGPAPARRDGAAGRVPARSMPGRRARLRCAGSSSSARARTARSRPDSRCSGAWPARCRSRCRWSSPATR